MCPAAAADGDDPPRLTASLFHAHCSRSTHKLCLKLDTNCRIVRLSTQRYLASSLSQLCKRLVNTSKIHFRDARTRLARRLLILSHELMDIARTFRVERRHDQLMKDKADMLFRHNPLSQSCCTRRAISSDARPSPLSIRAFRSVSDPRRI